MSVRVGQGFRDNDRREAGQRVVFVTALDCLYASVWSETEPHRRSRILRSRLESSAFSFVGEMGNEPSIWPKWFREDVRKPECDG